MTTPAPPITTGSFQGTLHPADVARVLNLLVGGALAELRHHWGDAYEITGRGRDWRARRRDGKGELAAPDPDALVEAIRADYERCPVPRDAR